jgi:hypothetical protein
VIWARRPSRAQLHVDAQLVGQAEFPVTTPIAFDPGGLTCGANPGSPITPDYQAPFKFTKTLHTITLHLSGDLMTGTEAKCASPWAASRQLGPIRPPPLRPILPLQAPMEPGKITVQGLRLR